MTTTFNNQIRNDLQTAYGSLSSPNWTFVEKRYGKSPYNTLIEKFGDFGAVQETTDLNDDVSVVVSITLADDFGVCVKLSLVGRYACISDSAGTILSRDELQRDDRTSGILTLLLDNNILILGKDELFSEVGFEEGLATVYGVLFSADGDR